MDPIVSIELDGSNRLGRWGTELVDFVVLDISVVDLLYCRASMLHERRQIHRREEGTWRGRVSAIAFYCRVGGEESLLLGKSAGLGGNVPYRLRMPLDA